MAPKKKTAEERIQEKAEKQRAKEEEKAQKEKLKEQAKLQREQAKLIKEKAKSDSKNPMWKALRQPHVDALQMALQLRDVDVNPINEDGRTPLLDCCFYGSVDKVRVLLDDPRVNVKVVDKKGANCLRLAVEGYHTILLRFLANHPRINPQEFGWDELHLACLRGDLPKVKEIMSNPPDLSPDGWNERLYAGSQPLLVAALANHIEIVRFLLADPRTKLLQLGYNTFSSMFKSKTYDLMKKLKNPEMANLFLSNPTLNLNEYQATWFYSACEDGDLELVKALLADKSGRVEYNDIGFADYTPFGRACSRGYVEIVKLLLQDPRIQVGLGFPMYDASREGHLEVVYLLLGDKRIDVNDAGDYDDSPLCVAILKGHWEIAKLLIADERVDFKRGNPALALLQTDQMELVKWMLAHRSKDCKIDASTFGKTKHSLMPLIQKYVANPEETVKALREELKLGEHGDTQATSSKRQKTDN